MALFDTLKTVLTPYAEKINKHTTDISILSEDVENVRADLNEAVDSLNGSLGDVKADLNEQLGIEDVTLTPSADSVINGDWYRSSSGKLFLNSTDQNYYTLAQPIDISSLSVGSEVSMLSSATGSVGVFITDENYVILDYVNGSNAVEKGYQNTSKLQRITLTVPTGAKYMTSDIRTAFYSGVSDFEISGTGKTQIDILEQSTEELSATLESGLSDVNSRIDDECIEIVKNIGVNLYDPSKATNGFIANANGVVQANSNYITSDYIPIANGQSVIVSYARDFLAYTDDRTPITSTYMNTVTSQYTYTANADGYIRASLFVSNASSNMIAYGTTLPSYEPYVETYSCEDDIHLSDTMKSDVETVIRTADKSKKLNVTISGNNYTILSIFGADAQLKRTLRYGGASNNVFEFNKTFLIKNGETTQIKSSGDDITPMRLKVGVLSMWTVGANHGWPCVRVAVGSLEQSDVGSTWTDGTNSYILANVTTQYAYFIFPATLTSGAFNFTRVLPSGNLSHVSGATHTGNIDITDATFDQLYPSVNNRSMSLYADELKITENGQYVCDLFTVIESYTIMDYADIGDYLKTHIGESLENDNIQGVVKVVIRYDFSETSCIVSTTYESLKEIVYQNCGTIQAQVVDASGNQHIYRYLNGVASGGMASSSVTDITNDGTGYLVSTADLTDVNVPTNRCVDIVKTNGVIDYGFTIGYIPDLGDGANSIRKSNNHLWELREETKKSYPTVFYNKHTNAMDVVSVIGYRNYVTPQTDVTNLTLLEVGTSLYVIFDAHERKTNYSIKVPYKYLGKTISVVESVNTELSTPIVCSRGIVLSMSDTYGCAVLKVN